MEISTSFPLAGSSETTTLPTPSGRLDSASGRKKCSTSIWVNSRSRNGPCRGAISLRKARPICAATSGSLPRFWRKSHGKAWKMPCAVSGRKYPVEPRPAPIEVANIRLKGRGVPSAPPHPSHVTLTTLAMSASFSSASPPSMRWSARCSFLHSLHSTNRSSNSEMCPDALKSASGPIVAPSSSSAPVSITNCRCQSARIFRRIRTPIGP